MLIYPSGMDVSRSARASLQISCGALEPSTRAGAGGPPAAEPFSRSPTCTSRVRHSYAQLATTGFGTGTTTAYHYVTKAVGLLADRTPALADAVRTASVNAFVLLDGIFLPIDRIAADQPFSSGEHNGHGMNVQVLTN